MTKKPPYTDKEAQSSFDLVFPEPVRKRPKENEVSLYKKRFLDTVNFNTASKQEYSIPPDKLHDEISKLKSKTNRTLLYLALISLTIFVINSRILLAGDIIPYIHLNSNDPIHKSILLAIGFLAIIILWSQLYLHITKTKKCFQKLEDSHQEYLDISGFYDLNSNNIELAYNYIACIISVFAILQSVIEIPVLINLISNHPIMPEDWVPVIERTQ